MRIAVFGGSFDPVHKEHIRLVKAALRELQLDTLFVMPAYAPPHKLGKELSPDKDRLAMCRLAFLSEPKVVVSEYEIQKKGTSYTYLTCQYFKEQYPDAELFWLVGTDMLRDFPTWKHPERILACVTLAVCGRDEKEGWEQAEQAAFFARFGKNFRYLSYNGEDISSTKIRVYAGAGLSVEAYTSAPVANYIRDTRLYEIPFAKEALELEKPSRREHSLRVARIAAQRAVSLHLSEKKAIWAGLLHDCAKNLQPSDGLLQGFRVPNLWGRVPSPVWHQFAGAYLAKERFGVEDEEVLRAIRYHTSGRANMGELEKLVFLADMIEEERTFAGVEELRALFWRDLDACLEKALEETVLFLRAKGAEVYPLTLDAYDFYKRKE